MTLSTTRPSPNANAWLKRYYFIRFAVAALWAVAALTIARDHPDLAVILLVAYPTTLGFQ